jgi:hypothetical protein
MAGFWSFDAAAVADFTEATSSPAKKKTLTPPVQAWQPRSASFPASSDHRRRTNEKEERIKGTQEIELKIVHEIVGSCRVDWK